MGNALETQIEPKSPIVRSNLEDGTDILANEEPEITEYQIASQTLLDSSDLRDQFEILTYDSKPPSDAKLWPNNANNESESKRMVKQVPILKAPAHVPTLTAETRMKNNKKRSNWENPCVLALDSQLEKPTTSTQKSFDYEKLEHSVGSQTLLNKSEDSSKNLNIPLNEQSTTSQLYTKLKDRKKGPKLNILDSPRKTSSPMNIQSESPKAKRPLPQSDTSTKTQRDKEHFETQSVRDLENTIEIVSVKQVEQDVNKLCQEQFAVTTQNKTPEQNFVNNKQIDIFPDKLKHKDESTVTENIQPQPMQAQSTTSELYVKSKSTKKGPKLNFLELQAPIDCVNLKNQFEKMLETDSRESDSYRKIQVEPTLSKLDSKTQNKTVKATNNNHPTKPKPKFKKDAKISPALDLPGFREPARTSGQKPQAVESPSEGQKLESDSVNIQQELMTTHKTTNEQQGQSLSELFMKAKKNKENKTKLGKLASAFIMETQAMSESAVTMPVAAISEAMPNDMKPSLNDSAQQEKHCFSELELGATMDSQLQPGTSRNKPNSKHVKTGPKFKIIANILETTDVDELKNKADHHAPNQDEPETSSHGITQQIQSVSTVESTSSSAKSEIDDKKLVKSMAKLQVSAKPQGNTTDRLEQLSKSIFYILKNSHNLGLSKTENLINVVDILQHPTMVAKNYTLTDVRRVVEDPLDHNYKCFVLLEKGDRNWVIGFTKEQGKRTDREKFLLVANDPKHRALFEVLGQAQALGMIKTATEFINCTDLLLIPRIIEAQINLEDIDRILNNSEDIFCGKFIFVRFESGLCKIKKNVYFSLDSRKITVKYDDQIFSDRELAISKALTFHLRHCTRLNQTGEMGDDGFIDLKVLLRKQAFQKYSCSIQDVKRLVELELYTSRSLVEYKPGCYKIKATHSHSIPRVMEWNWTHWQLETELAMLVHRCNYSSWIKVRQNGFEKKNRASFNFLNPNDKGTKTQREIEIWIDAAAARKDGLTFYKVPENDYIATEGLGSGLPLKYFIKAVDLESGEIIKVFN